MSSIWLISDTHFGHENILKFKDRSEKVIRDFSDVYEMNERMIERWNSVVRQGDKVYHLGDVYFGSGQAANDILLRLNGKKRLVLGNHDNAKDQMLQKRFEKITLWRKFNDFGLLLTHVPVHPSTLGESRFGGKSTVNVHGHTHQNGSPDGPYRSVCVEMTNYFPINIEELRVT